MIAMLTGTVHSTTQARTVIDVAGVGYLVHTTARLSMQLKTGQEIRLFTAMVVREDSQTLYGFSTDEEREIFDILTSVSGVGPKIGLATLNTLDVEQIRQAIADSDDKVFSTVSGIGPKSARRIVLELAGKLIVAPDESTVPAAAGSKVAEQLKDALVNLGWSTKDVDVVIEQLSQDEPEVIASEDVSAMLRSALRSFHGAGAQAKKVGASV